MGLRISASNFDIGEVRYRIECIMMDVASWFISALSGLPPWAVVIFISMLPFIELRGAIPAAMFVYNMPWHEAFLLSVIGNMIPVPFILRYMYDIERIFRRWKIFDRFFDWLFARTRRKAKDKIEKYGYLALLIFVGIPLPMTGAWTGALASYLFAFELRKAFLANFIGVVIAGVIISIVCVTGKAAYLGL